MEVTMDAILGLITSLVLVTLLAYTVSVLRYAASTKYKAQQALSQRLGGKINIPYTVVRKMAKAMEEAAARGQSDQQRGDG